MPGEFKEFKVQIPSMLHESWGDTKDLVVNSVGMVLDKVGKLATDSNNELLRRLPSLIKSVIEAQKLPSSCEAQPKVEADSLRAQVAAHACRKEELVAQRDEIKMQSKSCLLPHAKSVFEKRHSKTTSWIHLTSTRRQTCQRILQSMLAATRYGTLNCKCVS